MGGRGSSHACGSWEQQGKCRGWQWGRGAALQSHGQHSPCLELPPECTFSVVSLFGGAGDSQGSTHTTLVLPEAALPLQGILEWLRL